MDNPNSNIEITPKKVSAARAKYSKLEAHLIGLGAWAAAIGLNWLLGLHPMDKSGISLYSSALLIYCVVLSESAYNKSK